MNKITERITAVSNAAIENPQAFSPMPKAVKIELSGLCNLACWFCSTGKKERSQSMMQWDLFVKIIDELDELGVEEIGLFYLGESMMYPRLVEAIKYAKSKSFKLIFLTTNGVNATPKKVRDIMEAGLDSLKFSFNYKDRVSCIETTGKDKYDEIIANIQAAYRIRENGGYKCGLYISSVEYSEDAKEEMEPVLSQLRPYTDEQYWLPLYNHGAQIDTGKRKTQSNNVAFDGQEVNLPICWGLFSKTNITWDGKLSACCFDHKGEFNMGDLNEKSFEECWNSASFQWLRQKHIDGDIADLPCLKCLMKDHRGGEEDTGAHFALKK